MAHQHDTIFPGRSLGEDELDRANK
jgi:hypothetical protein